MNAGGTLTLRAHAKINLSLYVTGRRDDGYHDIVSVMQGVSLHDDVTVSDISDSTAAVGGQAVRSAELSAAGHRVVLSSDSDSMPFDMTNLAAKGAAAVLSELRDGSAYHIHISKRLPVAAGIAGGSGNAAAVMLAVDALTGYPYSLRELMDRGAAVGADVPFSLMMNAYRNREALKDLPGIEEASPAALMKGIGDIVEPVAPLDYHVIMMNPGTGVSTALAYQAIDRLPAPDEGPFELFYNVFEEYTYGADPEAARLRQNMDSHFHAEHTLLSGSGPTVVAYYKDRETALRDYNSALSDGWMDDNWKIWYAFSGGKEV